MTTKRPTRVVSTGLNRWVKVRVCLTAAVLVSLLGAVGWRAYALQVRDGDRYRELAKRQHLRTVELPAPRGAIFDATGKELAVTALSDSVFANPREVEDVNATAASLAEVLGLDRRTLENRLASPRYFAWVARHVTPQQAALVRDLELPGIDITREPRRFYPLKELAGPALGFAGIDGKGLDGIELVLDDVLVGARAKVAALRDASGGVMLADADASARAGAAVSLTIDRSVQFIAERALRRAVQQNAAKAGVALVLDIDSGGLLAVANWPSYDPNKPGNYVATGARNRAVADAYEIGSIMKVFTVAAALERGAVAPNTRFDVEYGRMRVGRKVIVDSYRDPELTVGGILKRSSNVGAYKVARRVGREHLYESLLNYGFNRKTGIELPGERSGVVHKPNTWGETGLAAVSYGYNMMVTPIQVIAAFAAVGAGGLYRPPRLVKEVRSFDGSVIYAHQATATPIMTKQTADALMPMLESVFDKGRKGGTARNLDLIGFRAAGKSGTAHKVDRERGGYHEDLYVSSFIGLAPVPNPRIAVFVIIDEPTGEEHYGATVAGPAFVEITGEALRYLGVTATPDIADASVPAGNRAPGQEEREDEEEPNSPDDDETAIAAAPTTSVEEIPEHERVWIPEFRGLGIARALDRASEAGVRLHVQGSGRAVEQYPPPGYARKPAECRVTFARAGESLVAR